MIHKDGKWAHEIISYQDTEGKWGAFHSLARSNPTPTTTEMALTRLERLGFTIEDECIQRAVEYMTDCLTHKKTIPDPREKLHDWDIFTDLMLSTRIRRFTNEVPEANTIAAKWAVIITAAFASGEYSHSSYVESYRDIHGLKPNGGRLIDFVNVYPVSLLRGELDQATENRMVSYILSHPSGIYYIYEKPLSVLPNDFTGKVSSRYIAAIEMLADYRNSINQLAFVKDWLTSNRLDNDEWDMGSTANDRYYFPLSDSWRKKADRLKDCTERISTLLNKL